jgi:hypothetical protein
MASTRGSGDGNASKVCSWPRRLVAHEEEDEPFGNLSIHWVLSKLEGCTQHVIVAKTCCVFFRSLLQLKHRMTHEDLIDADVHTIRSNTQPEVGRS